MSINSEIFESNGEQFTRSDYNGVNIIIRNKDGYINATKIAKDNGKQKHLDRFINSDKWKEICEAYMNEAVKNSLPRFRGRPENSEKFDSFDSLNEQEINLSYVIKSGTQEIYGTYVHPKLIHFVAEWCNISYAFKVATIMDNIDKIKTLRKTSGNYNLTQTIEKQCSEIKFLQGEIETKDKRSKIYLKKSTKLNKRMTNY